MINNKILYLGLVLIFLITFLSRLYKINNIPPGITNDEANYAYDALLLSQSGKDQWGKFLPMQFKGFGDYRLPIYQYLLVPLVKFKGLDPLFIRLPTIFFASLSSVMLFLLIKQVFKDKREGNVIGLLASLLLIFNPWYFGLSRVIMESNVGLFFVLTSSYFYLKSKESLVSFCLAVFFSIVSFYTYYGYRLFLPLFLLSLTTIKPDLIKNKLRQKVLIIILSFILLIPLLISFFGDGGKARFMQVNIFRNKSVVGQVNELLGECQAALPQLFCKVFLNKYSAYTSHFFVNYFYHFSPQFLFFEEFEKGWGFLPPSPYFYLINLPFFFIGLIYYLNKKEGKFFFIFLLLAPLADSLTGKGHYARSLIIIMPIIAFISMGWFCFFEFLKKKGLKYFVVLPLIVYLYLVGQFLVNYFIYFPNKHSHYTYYEYKPLFEYLKTVEKNYNDIYVSRELRDTKQYIFYLYYNNISASEYFNSDIKYYEEEDGWIKVEKINNYNFLDDAGKVEDYPNMALLATAPKTIKTGIKPLKTIYYLDGRNIAFLVFEVDKLKIEQQQNVDKNK